MLENLTRESLAAHMGSEFRLSIENGAQLALTLIEATSLGPKPAGGTGRAPFSVVFRGPRTPVLPQRIYRLEHERLGVLEIFIVPIGPDAHGLCYEAIFA